MTYPEMCYTHIASTNEIGIIKWGESGYYSTDYSGNPKNIELVHHLNEKIGVSPTEAEAMSILSMNESLTSEGWGKKYEEVLAILQKKGAC